MQDLRSFEEGIEIRIKSAMGPNFKASRLRCCPFHTHPVQREDRRVVAHDGARARRRPRFRVPRSGDDMRRGTWRGPAAVALATRASC